MTDYDKIKTQVLVTETARNLTAEETSMKSHTEADLEQLEIEARIGRMVLGRAETLGWKNDGESVLDFLMRTIPFKESEQRRE